MWRLVIALGLLFGIGSSPSTAQQWSGTAGLDATAGYQTNLYLDPVIGTWNRKVRPTLIALTPSVGLTRTSSTSRLDLTVRSRVHPRRENVPQLSQTVLRLRRRVAPDWTLGLTTGGTRYRFTTDETNITTARENWWLLPSLQWSATRSTMIRLRTGLTQRFERSFEPTDRQTSGLASVRLTHWFTDRFQGGVRVYSSNGRTSVAETGFGGRGGAVTATYWPSGSVSIQGSVAAEQLQYELADQVGTTASDQIGRVGLTVEWAVRPSFSMFGRAQGLSAELDQSTETTTDVHLSAGLRLQVQSVFGESTDPPPQRRVCRQSDDGVQFRVPYEGSGTVHVTGDFNSWSLPGIPMTRTDDNVWTTTIDLPPGRYEYRLRVVENDDAHWLDLPSYAQTAKDSFGSTNGVCIAH